MKPTALPAMATYYQVSLFLIPLSYDCSSILANGWNTERMQAYLSSTLSPRGISTRQGAVWHGKSEEEGDRKALFQVGTDCGWLH